MEASSFFNGFNIMPRHYVGVGILTLAGTGGGGECNPQEIFF